MNRKKRVLAIGATGPEFDQTANLPASTIPTESGALGWTVVCEVGENTVVKLSQRDHILARIDAAKREILVADSMVKLFGARQTRCGSSFEYRETCSLSTWPMS